MIKVLVADDSALIRRLFSETFAEAGGFEVETARDGVEALERLAAFRPDVVTLDVHMPKLDGFACLDRIMLERPTPVVIVSAVTQAGADESVRALELGAVEVVAKPSGALSLKMDRFGPQLVAAVRAASQARISKTRRLADRVRSRIGPLASPPKPRARPTAASDGLVVVGCSTGGPAALDVLLSALPADFPWPLVVAQHMPAAFTGALARRLDALTPLSVREVSRTELLRPGAVYIGRGGADVLVAARPGGLTAVTAPQSEAYLWRPR
jgi:two-component system chemotaxis response regulator CheB